MTRQELIENAIQCYGEEYAYQTKCASYVAYYFGLLDLPACKYLHTTDDILKGLKSDGWNYSEIELPENIITVNDLPENIEAKTKITDYILVFVHQHVLLIRPDGFVIADSHPEINDWRRVFRTWRIYK